MHQAAAKSLEALSFSEWKTVGASIENSCSLIILIIPVMHKHMTQCTGTTHFTDVIDEKPLKTILVLAFTQFTQGNSTTEAPTTYL